MMNKMLSFYDWDLDNDLPFELYTPLYKASDGIFEFGPMSHYYGCEIISDNPDNGPLVLMRFYLPKSLTTDADNKWDNGAIELGKLWEISVREIIAKILPSSSYTQDTIYAHWFIPIAPEKRYCFSQHLVINTFSPFFMLTLKDLGQGYQTNSDRYDGYINTLNIRW